MRRAGLLLLGAALAAGATLAVGCVLFTGSTEGYTVAAEAGGASCSSAASCETGNVCCLVVNASTTSAAGTCEPQCSVSYPQLCTTNAECGDAGPCNKLSCTIDAGGGISFSLQACGTIPGCQVR